MSRNVSVHGQWSSKAIFILAALGSTLGLGNIWKFPYLAGENGGGAFVLVYLLSVALIGIPIMMAEVALGRRARQSPVNTFDTLAWEQGASHQWRMVGGIGVLSGLLIVSFYSVVAGWTLAYLVRAVAGTFAGLGSGESERLFLDLVTDPERLLAWHTVFLVLVVMVLSRGVRSGIEKLVRYLMPVLFLILVLLVIYAWQTGKMGEGFNYLFAPDFQKLTPTSVLVAMGHAFFTLSLGMGVMLIYGSYLPSGVSIARGVCFIAVMDTVAALLAGLAVIPLVLANGLPLAAGPGLVFDTLPVAFGAMPGGYWFGILFFLLLFFAALTSAISLMEPSIAWLVESMDLPRLRAAIWVGILAWSLGIVTILSFSSWSFDFHFAGQLKTNGWYDGLDILTSGFLLPLGGLATALFTGWVVSRERLREQLGGEESLGFRLWYLLIRYVSPMAVVLIFLNVVGVL